MGRVLTWGLWIGVALVAVTAAVPYLVPLSRFIPPLTELAAQKLGQRVEIGDLQLQLLPTPRAVVRQIRVGRKGEVTLGELEIVPDLLSFASGPRTVRLIRAERVELQEAALLIPAGMPKGQGGGEPLLVRRIELREVKLHHSALRLPVLDAEAELGEALQLRRARLAARDGSLQLEVTPQAGGAAAVSLEAKNWTVPAGVPLVFEALAAQGTLKGSQLDVPKIDGRLYGGRIAGSVRADWTKLWQVSGKASLSGVDLVPVQQALGKPAKISGRLKADAAFASRAKAPAQLGDALSLDGPFEVLGGVYRGVDLSKAGDLTGKTVDDATQFEELKGRLQLRGKHVKVNDLCVRSPKVVAGGHVEIASDQKLSGRLDVSVAKTGGFVGVPVSLGGTTEDPSIRPTRGYLIGAAIGTVVLPGIGTSIGSSIGSRIEGTSSCK